MAVIVSVQLALAVAIRDVVGVGRAVGQIRERRRSFRCLIAMIVIRSAECCALVLVGCGMPPALEGLEAPVVVRGEFREVPTPAEAVVLAHRILQRESDELLLDTGKRHAFARNIQTILSRIRNTHPATADVAVRQSHALGQLILGVEPDLLRILSDVLDDATDPVTLRTGYAEFDALNARLGLSAVALYLDTAVFYVDEHANIEAAIEAYVALEGIGYAEPNVHLGDGPDIEASMSQGIWHVVVRNAWGDCPSGCVDEELFFFTVQGPDVERIERLRAMDRDVFAALVESRGWR